MELNHTNTNRGHLEPGSFLNNLTSGKKLMRSGDHQEAVSSDKRLEPSFYSAYQVCFLVTMFLCEVPSSVRLCPSIILCYLLTI